MVISYVETDCLTDSIVGTDSEPVIGDIWDL